MSPPKALLIDVDGVIFNWKNGFMSYMDARYKRINPHIDPDAYSLDGTWEGIGEPELRVTIADFNKAPEFADLKFVPDATPGIYGLMAYYPNHEVVIATASGVHPYTLKTRLQSLAHLNIDRFYAFDLNASKGDFYKRWHPDSIVVEDSASQAQAALEAGLKVLLLDYNYNRSFASTSPRFRRVRDWRDLRSLLLIEDEFHVAA